MIRFHHVSFTYPEAVTPALAEVDLTIDEGQLCLVVGPTGSGKSTLLGAVNGLVPRFTGGVLTGTVEVDGRFTHSHRLKEMADLVGVVAQDPGRGFAAETVEDELAYTMEQLGVGAQAMRRRVEETLDLLGLAHLRARRLSEISGGEAQRVAIGSVLTAHPRVLVMDEPTSALDPTAAEEVLATVTRLVHDLGMTVVMAEHRLERVIQYADQVVHISPGGVVTSGEPVPMMSASEVAPPVVELARLARWSPAPLSVREARRHASRLKQRLGASRPHRLPPPPGETALRATGVSVAYAGVVAVRSVGLELAAGSVTAVMGRNGAGKSSLLWALQGSGRRSGGRVEVAGVDPVDLGPGEARKLVGLVPQTPADLLYLETVEGECRQADTAAGASPGTCATLAGRLVGPLDPASHPADLSEGEKLALALAIQLSAGPRVLLLDEPTRGLDYPAKLALAGILHELAGAGTAAMVATHDVEFVASAAHRVLVMAEGEVVADGPTAEVVVASPAFAPQVAKIMAPDAWLTVAEVDAALAGETV